MAKQNNKDELDIFKKAAASAFDKIEDNLPIEKVVENKDVAELNEKDEKDVTEAVLSARYARGWNNLMDKMVTDYPEKLQAIMDEASPREFVRIYFKLLEYARPKKVRDTPVDFEEDNTLHIHVHTQQEEKTNNKIIDID